jgi:hypothetical protein
MPGGAKWAEKQTRGMLSKRHTPKTLALLSDSIGGANANPARIDTEGRTGWFGQSKGRTLE